jgi:ribosomal protein L29
VSKVTDPSEPGPAPEDPPVPAEDDAGSSAAPSRTRWRRRARVKAPTQRELDALPAERRLELLDQRRQSRHQTLNSVGILFGVVFTAGSLIATALSVRSTQDELRSAKEGQITDRYTKAVEQLSSGKRDVRLGAIYALERIAADSKKDRPTIVAVLAAFTREHDPAPRAELPDEPYVEIQAALAVLGHQPLDPPGEPSPAIGIPQAPGSAPASPPFPDLHGIRTPSTQLQNANLTRANLGGANLSSADLSGADLRGYWIPTCAARD